MSTLQLMQMLDKIEVVQAEVLRLSRNVDALASDLAELKRARESTSKKRGSQS
jgi:hypothetical protein